LKFYDVRISILAVQNLNTAFMQSHSSQINCFVGL